MRLPKFTAETAIESKQAIQHYVPGQSITGMENYTRTKKFLIIPEASRYYNAHIHGYVNANQCNTAFDDARAYNIFTVSHCDDYGMARSCFRRIKQTDGYGVDQVRRDFQRVIDHINANSDQQNISVDINTRSRCT